MPSVMQRVGTPNAQHNRDLNYRKHLDHIDPSLSKHNEIIRSVSVEELYAKHLQPAFDAFNEKQKRKDRRLDVKYGVSTYLEYQRELDKQGRASRNAIDQKGRPPIRELILQFGNPEQGYGSAGQTQESRERIKGMLLEAQSEIEKRYPQLVWGDSIFHADETSLDADGKQCGTLHLHSSFVPLCFKNKRGPEVQVAFERCLAEMGFDSFAAWKHDLDTVMESVLQRHGLERTMMGNEEKHQDYKEFHRQQQLIVMTKELEKKKSGILDDVEAAQAKFKSVEQKRDETKREADAQAERIRNNRQEELRVYSSVNKGREELREVQAAVKDGQEKAEELREEIEELNAFIEGSQDVLVAYEEKIVDLQSTEKELESRLDCKREELGQAEERVRELDDLPRKHEELRQKYNRAGEQVIQLTEENNLLRRMLGAVMNFVKKLVKREEITELAATAIEAYVGNKAKTDVADVLRDPVQEKYKEKVLEREEQARLDKAREEALRRQRQQEARVRQKVQENEK